MLNIDQEQLNTMFVKATKQVFLDLLDVQDLEPGPAIFMKAGDGSEDAHPRDFGLEGELRGMRIDFHGDFHGGLMLYFAINQARHITRSFFLHNELEVPDSYVDDNIDEILGEMSNMISGLFKGCLLRTNLKCLLGLPSTLGGDCVDPQTLGTVQFRTVTPFFVCEDIFVADLVFFSKQD